MRAVTDKDKLLQFMAALGARTGSEGAIYLTGGATAVLYEWRRATIDIDIKADPEPDGLFQAIAALKDELDVNVELASPDLFIPAVPGWRERSVFIARHGQVSFYHYDPYGQALAKLQRRHDRDLRDVEASLRAGLIRPEKMREFFVQIEPQLVRYPAIDAASFATAVNDFCMAAERGK
jgi:hypothetical protein